MKRDAGQISGSSGAPPVAATTTTTAATTESRASAAAQAAMAAGAAATTTTTTTTQPSAAAQAALAAAAAGGGAAGAASSAALPRLPAGLQTFSKIRTMGCVYVDKTKEIIEFVQSASYAFFSRPRRFGKSLLVSTISELFSGNQKAFEGLAVAQSDYSWPKHSVIRFDFSELPGRSEGILERNLVRIVKDEATRLGIDIQQSESHAVLKELIVGVAAKTGKRVVVLVDEYDAPINSCILNNELLGQLTEVLKQFFAVIKAQDEHIHYSLITGITKFSHVSLFSGANQFLDLSDDPATANLLGFSENEIRTAFAAHLEAISTRRQLSLDQVVGEIRTWYNGYRFSLDSDQQVYNPFAVVSYLRRGVTEDYWFRSGTPTLVFQLLTQEPSRLVEFWGAHAEKKLFLTDSELKGKIDMTQVAGHVTALLFQTGYLTIQGSVDDRVRVDFPNKEVSTSFVNGLLKHRHTGGARQDPGRFVREATAGLRTGDPTKFFDHLQALIAGIPYQLHGGKEGYYHSLVHMASFFLPECRYQSECSMATGRIDLVIELGKRVYIMEFKKDSSAQVALDQIDENKYYEKYHHRFDEIILVGANFCTQKKRNLDGWIKHVVRPSGPRAGAASSTTTTTTTASS